MKKLKEAIWWTGEVLFIVFVLLPGLLILLWKWQDELTDDIDYD